MGIFSKKHLPLWISLVFTPLLNSPASAGAYDALCESLDCKIVLAGNGITGPRGFIPSHRVVQWYTGGGVDHNRAAQAVGAGGGGYFLVLFNGEIIENSKSELENSGLDLKKIEICNEGCSSCIF